MVSPPISSPSPAVANSLTNGIAIVRLMVQSGHSIGVTGIAKALDLPKSSVHRILQSLQLLGFVQRLETGRYTVSADIFDFVHEIARNFGRNLRLEDQLRTAAHDLACNVYLSMLGRRDIYVICAAGEEGNTARLGIHAPAHASSAGKVLIAQKDSACWASYAPSPAETLPTPFTNRDSRKFIAELRKVRKAGIAWNHRQTSPDHVSLATTVSEPFLPVPRIALALVLRYDDFISRDPVDLESKLRSLASELERELGSR